MKASDLWARDNINAHLSCIAPRENDVLQGVHLFIHLRLKGIQSNQAHASRGIVFC